MSELEGLYIDPLENTAMCSEQVETVGNASEHCGIIAEEYGTSTEEHFC